MSVGLVLAGGRATRLGGIDKGFLFVGGIRIIDRIVATLQRQCDRVLISANGDATRFAELGCEVVSDEVAGQGPLAGVLSGLEAIVGDPGCLVTVPTDTPFLPGDLVTRLEGAASASRSAIVCARSGGRRHPTIALWPLRLRDDLRRALDDDGLRKVGAYLERHALIEVDWPADPYDPFANVNTPEDLAAAETIAVAHHLNAPLAVPPRRPL